MTTSPGLSAGSPQYHRAVAALLCAGLATFNSLYTTQALLPRLVTEFHITTAQAALTVSGATGALAVCVVPAAILSERLGRGPVLIGSALLTTLVGLLVPLAPTINILILIRCLQGVFIAGVPAVAMTWLSEEIRASDLTKAMGVYIAGNSVGGISGRLIPSPLLAITDWRHAMFASNMFALILAILMVVLLPKQQRFTPKNLTLRSELRDMCAHMRSCLLVFLFSIAFILMGTFVSLYNFVGFRLIHTFGLTDVHVGLLYLLYLSGTITSMWAGRLNQRYGHARILLITSGTMVMGLLLCLGPLECLAVGLLLFTAAFFLAHSTASAAVGLLAKTNRGEAAGLYIFFYYTGSSVLGWISGYLFDAFAWTGFILWLTAWTLFLLVISVLLSRMWPKVT